MYLRHNHRSYRLIQKHYSIQKLFEQCLIENKKLTYRKLVASIPDFSSLGGLHKYITKLKKLGMKTNII